MKGFFIVNKYYKDEGIDYIFSRLKQEFSIYGVELVKKINEPLVYESNCSISIDTNADFAIYFDKDISIAKAYEKVMPIFNCSLAIELCDDKEKTYNALSGHNINIPKTISPPLSYDNNLSVDEKMLNDIQSYLSYPIIIKDNVGSQGRQVYLCNNYDELLQKHKQLLHTRHIFQEFISNQYGTDIRMYVIGGKFVASCKRENTTSYKSNVFAGAKVKPFSPSKELIDTAEKISKILHLDYGAIDFVLSPKPLFLEANSNAYFRGIESLDINIAKHIVDYIVKVMRND